MKIYSKGSIFIFFWVNPFSMVNSPRLNQSWSPYLLGFSIVLCLGRFVVAFVWLWFFQCLDWHTFLLGAIFIDLVFGIFALGHHHKDIFLVDIKLDWPPFEGNELKLTSSDLHSNFCYLTTHWIYLNWVPEYYSSKVLVIDWTLESFKFTVSLFHSRWI